MMQLCHRKGKRICLPPSRQGILSGMDQPIGFGVYRWKDARREALPTDELEALDERASRVPVGPYEFGPASELNLIQPIGAVITGNASAPLYSFTRQFPNSANNQFSNDGSTGLLTGTASAVEINGNLGVPVGAYVLMLPNSSLSGAGWWFSYGQDSSSGQTVNITDDVINYSGDTINIG